MTNLNGPIEEGATIPDIQPKQAATSSLTATPIATPIIEPVPGDLGDGASPTLDQIAAATGPRYTADAAVNASLKADPSLLKRILSEAGHRTLGGTNRAPGRS